MFLYTFCLLLHISNAASYGHHDFNLLDNTLTTPNSTQTFSSGMLQGTKVLIVMHVVHAGPSTCYLWEQTLNTIVYYVYIYTGTSCPTR